MGVPKNYNKTVNLKKRIESLNELEFYTFRFDVTYTEGYEKILREAEINGNVLINDIEVVGKSSTNGFNKVCVKRFSAQSEDDANRKMGEWLEILKEKEMISDYLITDIVSNTFYEELDEKGLLPLLDGDEFNRVREESKKGVI